MVAAKKHIVKLKVSPSFLETLPVFATPKPKARAKKASVDDKKAISQAGSPPASSPAPTDEAPVSKINTGPKETSTAGLAVNSVTQALDKSGRPCRRWTKGSSQFKTFSGFRVKLKTWKTKDVRKTPKVDGLAETVASAVKA